LGGDSAYRVPSGTAWSELREKGSRFLAILGPARSEASAREQIGAYREEYSGASHVCWAWRIGSPPREGRSDAGEPAGTAGTPILQVLRGSDLSDVLAVVVRWFGGVKLGKGGLARAYAGAVREALAELRIVERRAVVRLRVSLPYDRVGDLKRLIHPPAVEAIEESYADEVTVTLEVERRHMEDVAEALNIFAITVEETGV